MRCALVDIQFHFLHCSLLSLFLSVVLQQLKHSSILVSHSGPSFASGIQSLKRHWLLKFYFWGRIAEMAFAKVSLHESWTPPFFFGWFIQVPRIFLGRFSCWILLLSLGILLFCVGFLLTDSMFHIPMCI